MDIARITELPFVWHITLALALGLLIGVQRGWALRQEAAGTRFAGVRTFGLLGLAGGFAGALAPAAEALSAVLLAASAALVVLGYWRISSRRNGISGTGSIVSLLTLACGYLAGGGQAAPASATAGLMVLVLAMRSQLHGWVRALEEREMIAIARFGLIALVVLPLLPNTPFGPMDAWRARQLWLVVVMVSGFSFAGYIAAKRFGATRGVLATAAAGSLVSSTAVTASLAGKLKAGDGDPAVLNAGIALASAVMFTRVMVLTGALAPLALPTLSAIAVPGLLVSLGCTVFLLRHAQNVAVQPADEMSESDQAESRIELRNPFDLKPALLLMALTMALTLAARWVLARYGDAGVATVLALSGLVDVDSAIITMGNLPSGTLSPRMAGLVLAPPILLNTAVKAGMALSLAGGRKAWPGAVALLASLIAGLLAVPLLV